MSKETVTTFRTRASRLVILRRDDNVWGLWAVDPASDQEHQIVRGWDGDLKEAPPPPVTISPDGDRVAYVMPSPGSTWSLWVARLDGSERNAIVRDQSGLVSTVTWSPRGDLIAYEQSQVFQGIVTSPKVWIGGVDGSSARPIHESTGWSYSRPTWSPDGGSIAFTRQPLRVGPLQADPELWIVGLDGTSRRLPTGGWLAAWAP